MLQRRPPAAFSGIGLVRPTGTGPLPHPATHERILDGWPGGGAGRCRFCARRKPRPGEGARFRENLGRYRASGASPLPNTS